jgi:D-alanyl-D-alanine carboxypeptidase (penicillin-binding protein 5/6)
MRRARGARRALEEIQTTSEPKHRSPREVNALRGLAVMFVVLVLLVVLGDVAFNRAFSPQPVASIRPVTLPPAGISGVVPPLPFPAGAQSATYVPSVGFASQSGPEHSVSVASLTKIMTAYIILKDHPLGLSENGPKITMTPTDVSYFNEDTVTDQASAQVSAGEVLTERQALEGLLIHSANNLAETLARWDAGSVPAFVAKMNATAASLGMQQTHYVDPNGFNPGSMSTPDDLLRVTAVAMEEPVFAQTVRLSSVTLPVAGTLSTYTPLLTYPGVVGVKSGFTSEAGGCDVLAYVINLEGKPVVAYAAVTGIMGPNVINMAGFGALDLANHVALSVRVVHVLSAGQRIAWVSANGQTVPATATASVSMLVWPGTEIRPHLRLNHRIRAGAHAGTEIGVVTIASGDQSVSVPVRLSGALHARSLSQRLF